MRAGWLATAVLLAHTVVIGLFAVPLAGFAPQEAPVHIRHDPGGLYGFFLGTVLIGPALLAAVGGLFHRPEPPWRPGLRDNRPEDRDDRTDSLVATIALVTGVPWVAGWLVLSLLTISSANRYELPLIPSSGMRVLAVGAALAVPSIAVAVFPEPHQDFRRPG
ncbi:hypothetical protein AB0J83_31665 [Actinoplanes sp. NPDC049596]|uniref:hypothetical protein n=1 Tax=unclassified Actinoplanes TaxID=2626549 RepID=UPI00341A9EA4